MESSNYVIANLSLEDFLANPSDNMEWVDGKLIKKASISLKCSKIIANLFFHWKNYIISNKSTGGTIELHIPCLINNQVRCPDIAYLTPELIEKFGKLKVLPQSFPLIAEIISPTDLAEDLFLKARQYLDSGCLEVWLIFPESCFILVITQEQFLRFISGQIVNTQKILPNFSIGVDELFDLKNVSNAQNSPSQVNQIISTESSKEDCKYGEEFYNTQVLFSQKEVYKRFKKLISEQLGVDIDYITPTYCLADANIDTLDIVELNLALEEEFDIEISDPESETLFKYSVFSASSSFLSTRTSCNNDSWNGVVTVQDIVDYIQKKLTK